MSTKLLGVVFQQFNNQDIPKRKMTNEKKQNRSEAIAYLGLTLMTTIIGFSFIFVKLALNHAPTIDLLAHRFSVAAIAILLFYILVRREKPKINRKEIAPLLLLSIFYPVLLFALQTIGLRFTTASEAGIISAAAPIITLILASIFLKEKSNIWQTLSIFLSVGGIVYIMYKNGVSSLGGETLKGNIFILLSVTAMAIYFVIGRRVTQKINAVDITLFMTITACVVFNILAISSHLRSGTLSTYFEAFSHKEFMWSILYLGVLSSVLTSFLTNNALTVILASQVSIFNNLSPIIAVFAGVIFLSETLHSYHIIGGVMVVLGVVGVNVIKK